MFFDWENGQPWGGAFLFGESHTSLELWAKLVEHKLSLFILFLTVSLLDFLIVEVVSGSTALSASWEIINATSGAVIHSEDWKLCEDMTDGSQRPRPPRRTGSASRSLSIEEHGGRPVSAYRSSLAEPQVHQWCNYPDFQRPHATGESSKCIPFKKHQWGVLKLKLVPKTGESILRSTRDILKEKYPPALRQRLSQKILMALEKGFVASGPLLHRGGWFLCRRPHHYRNPM